MSKDKLYILFMAGVALGSAAPLGKYGEYSDKELEEAFNKIMASLK